MTKKIAILAPRFYRYGGMPRVVRQIVNRLDHVEDLEFKIFTARTNEESKSLVNCEVIEINTYPYPLLSFFNPLVKRKIFENDLIWTQQPYLNRLALSTDTPVIFTYHSLHRRFAGIANRTSIKDKVESYLTERGTKYIQYADRSVGISEYTKDQLNNLFQCRAVKIPHGGNFVESFGGREVGEFIFCPDEAEETVVQISKEYPVKAIGSGNCETIEYVGNISDSELAELYKKSRFVVTGSGKEGFGITPIEAGFFRTPSVVRAVGGHKETIEDGKTGFLADNSLEFKKKVEELWKNDEKVKEMGNNAFEEFRDKYNWDRSAMLYLEEFNDLLKTDFNFES